MTSPTPLLLVVHNAGEDHTTTWLKNAPRWDAVPPVNVAVVLGSVDGRQVIETVVGQTWREKSIDLHLVGAFSSEMMRALGFQRADEMPARD